MTKNKFLKGIERFCSFVRSEATIRCPVSQRRSLPYSLEQFNSVGKLDIRPSSVGTILSPPLSQLEES